MYYSIASAPVHHDSYTKKPAGGSLELFSTETEAVLSWQGKQLIHFESSVKVAGEEVLDWVNKGLLTELTGLEKVGESNGMQIMAREAAPVFAETRFAQEPSNRSLLLNPTWFSIYFVSFWEPVLEEEALRELRKKLLHFFETGKALADYQRHKIYICRFLGIAAAPAARD